MTEPKKSDHWNSLLDEIGIPASDVRPEPPKTEVSTPPPTSPPPRPRGKAEPKPRVEPPKKSGWNSLLGALGLAAPEEPAPPPPPAAEVPPRAVERVERDELPAREEHGGGHLLDEFKPRYKPEEPPFPPSRRREMVDDVALDIDLDADFAGAERPVLEPAEDEPAGDMAQPPPARRDDAEHDERGGRRRRRRRGGRNRDRDREESHTARPREPQLEPEESSIEDINLQLDFDVEPPLELDDEALPHRDEPPPREPSDEARRRRRRRGRGRERDRGEARTSAEGRPARRPERMEREERGAETRSRVRDDREDDEPIETMDDLGDDEDSASGDEHAVHKKIPTWAETVGILVDANIAARSSRQPDRGRPRRPRRGDR